MSEHRRPRRSPLSALRHAKVRAVLSLGIVLGFGSVSTFAYWTDQATVQGGAFTAGTLNIKVGDPVTENDPTDFTASFALIDMVPGSTKDAVLKVYNAGSVGFTWAVTGSATNSGAGTNQMGSAIRITVYPSSTAGVCTGTAIIADKAPSQVTFTRPELAKNANTSLCFRAALPGAASTDLQGQTTEVTFTLRADQVL